MKDIPTSPRIIKIRHKRRMRRLRLSVLFFILFISIIGALSFYSSNSRIVIDKVVVSGNNIIDQDSVQKLVNRDISGKYIYLFSRSNSFIYPNRKIYNDLILSFPRIESLSVSRDGLKTIHINISERSGSYLYCGANIPEDKESVGENCFFVNDEGLIFDTAPYFSGNVYFKYYLNLENNENNPLGKQMLSVDEFHKLVRFIDGVTSLGFKPIYILMDKDGNNYLYLSSTPGATVPKIIFKREDNLDVILDNISLSMKKREFADEINSKYNSLLYIDLRFKDKVLYKFQ